LLSPTKFVHRREATGFEKKLLDCLVWALASVQPEMVGAAADQLLSDPFYLAVASKSNIVDGKY